MSHFLRDHKLVRHTRLTNRRMKSLALAITILLFVVYSALRVNWFPSITLDGLNYLDHSNDLVGIRFVQHGYRQFAYPAWLAFVDATARMSSLEPLGLTVVLQRLFLIAGAGVTVLVLRGWSVPIVFVLLSPSSIAFSNYILTETIAMPIAVIGAAASVAILQNRRREQIEMWLGVAATSGILLPMIRLQYALISIAIAVAILAAGRVRESSRRKTIVALSVMSLTLILLVGALALDNLQKHGVLSPSIGAERQMFWATWENVVVFHRDEVAEAVPDVYLDGTTFAFIREMDSSDLSAGEQRAVYALAVEQIYSATGVSQTGERFRSLAGVMTGSRLDDIGGNLRFLATPVAPENFDVYIHQYAPVVSVDPDRFGDQYNDGIAPTFVLAASHMVPAFPSPDLKVMMAYLIPMMMMIGMYLLWFAHARLLAAIAVGVMLAYSVASFAFMMDNLRFLLPAYLFSITLILGALREYWRHDRTPGEQPMATG